ncbi:MAG TPA: hypothetical protein VL442_08850 [Mucilaginibacter sp.]|nr:hypothetical protein [Mucilaginibacter sp.]
MTTADKKNKKKDAKNAIKSDLLMSEDMKHSLLSEHSSKHGKPANETKFYQEKIKSHPDKK